MFLHIRFTTSAPPLCSLCPLWSILLFEVAAELESHGGEEFVLEFGIASGAKAFVEGGCEHWDGNGFVDGGFDGPTPFAGVADAAGEVFEVGILDEGIGGEVEKPAATTLPRRHTSDMSVRLRSYW